MATNWDHFKDTASRMILRWGMPAVLRRRGMADRPCTVAVLNFTPFERAGQLLDPVDRKCLIAAEGLTIPPDRELDVVVTFVQPMTVPPVESELLTITAPVGRVEMAGKTVMWRLTVRR